MKYTNLLSKNEVSDTWRKNIREIENQFLSKEFSNDFKLESFIFSILEIIKIHQSTRQKSTTNSKIRKKLKKRIKILSVLVNELSIAPDEIKVLENSTAETLIKIFPEYNGSNWQSSIYSKSTDYKPIN